jgi:hypothetical protein
MKTKINYPITIYRADDCGAFEKQVIPHALDFEIHILDGEKFIREDGDEMSVYSTNFAETKESALVRTCDIILQIKKNLAYYEKQLDKLNKLKESP